MVFYLELIYMALIIMYEYNCACLEVPMCDVVGNGEFVKR